MKKLLTVLLLVSLVVSCTAFAAKRHVTLDDFYTKYKEASVYVNSLLARNLQPTALQLGYTTDGSELLSFMIEEKEFTVQGNAFPDTGVISSIVVTVKKNESANIADQLALAGIFYGLSEFENIGTSIADPKFSQMMNDLVQKMEKGGTFGDYKIEMIKLDDMGGLAGKFSFTFNGKAPKADEVSNAKDVSYYAGKYMGKNANNGARTLSSGEYVVGTHLPSGEYSVKAESSAYIVVQREGKSKVSEVLDNNNEIGRLVLQDGDIVEISIGRVIFSPFQ